MNAVLVPGASKFRNFALDRIMKKNLTPIISEFRNKFILEIGCGVGRWSQILSNKNFVVGIDLSRSMINIAKNSSKKNSFFILADAANLPFQNDVFDLTLSITVMQHILRKKDFVKTINDIGRCTKSKVILIEEMWSKKEILLDKVYCPIRIYSMDRYLHCLKKVKFDIHDCRGLTFAPLAILFVKLISKGKTIEKNTEKLKESKLVSSIIHFIMGAGILTSLFNIDNNHSPYLSLHSIVYAQKLKCQPN